MRSRWDEFRPTRTNNLETCDTKKKKKTKIAFLSDALEGLIRTASDYQRTELTIHWEVPQFHRTLGFDSEPAQILKGNA